jgi:hypothetical protein
VKLPIRIRPHNAEAAPGSSNALVVRRMSNISDSVRTLYAASSCRGIEGVRSVKVVTYAFGLDVLGALAVLAGPTLPPMAGLSIGTLFADARVTESAIRPLTFRTVPPE